MTRKREVVLFLIIVLLAGCAASKQAKDVTSSGFLGDYSKLVKGEEGQELYRYTNPRRTGLPTRRSSWTRL